MKKKVLSFVLVFCLMIGSIAYLPFDYFCNYAAVAYGELQEGDFGYTVLEDGTAEITTYNGNGYDVTVPSKIAGYDVSCLNRAFANNTKIEIVRISNGITKIRDNAFVWCSSLERVDIPDSINDIESGVFSYCTNITSVIIPKGVTKISDSLFYNCSCLISVSIPNSVTEIGSSAFGRCESLKKIELPNNLRKIDSSAFSNCNNLVSINVPDGVEELGSGAFGGCSSLTSIKIPTKIDTINPRTYSGCSGLKEISIPTNILYIEKEAFAGCHGLTTVVIPNSVRSIGERAFNYCKNLESVVLSDSVKRIGEYAFSECKNLLSVIFGKGVQIIDSFAFDNCSKLNNVSFHEGLKTIGLCAFQYCNSLTNMTIPRSVTVIEDYGIGSVGGAGTTEGFVVYCYSDSATEKYAKKYNLDYVLIDQFDKYPVRISGNNRYATAAAISKNTYKTADTVILACGTNYADALAGIPLAKYRKAPILLSSTNSLPAETLTEIQRLGARNVIILGGTGAVSSNVENTLRKKGLEIERIAGKTRYGTAAEIARRINTYKGEVVFVYANSFADALSVSTVAAIKGAPILYLNTSGKVNDETANFLYSYGGNYKKGYVVGGTGVIKDEILSGITDIFRWRSDFTIERIAGANRYETCIAVNNKFAEVFSSNSICVAKGLDFPDALAGGIFAANQRAPLFLADNRLTSSQKSYLKKNKSKNLFVLGGTGAVPNKLVSEITKALA